MSSIAVDRGLQDLELWLAGLFSAPELAAAELLLQLSVAKGIDDEEAASSSATTSPSPRSVRTVGDSEDLTVQEEEEKKEGLEERVVEKPAVSTELDRRAKKRYRRLSELYAATVPVTSASAAKKNKRKRHHRGDTDGSSSESSVDATR